MPGFELIADPEREISADDAADLRRILAPAVERAK